MRHATGWVNPDRRLPLSESVISAEKRGQPSRTGRRGDSVSPREAENARRARRGLLAAAISTAVSLDATTDPRNRLHLGIPVQQPDRLLASWLGKNNYNKPEMPAARPPLGVTGEGDVLRQGNVLDVMTLQSLKFTLVLRLSNMWKHQRDIDSNSGSLPLSRVCV